MDLEQMIEQARIQCLHTKQVGSVIMEGQKTKIFDFKPTSRKDKTRLLQRARHLAKLIHAHTAIFMCEAWATTDDHKEEVVIITAETLTSRLVRAYDIVRGDQDLIIDLVRWDDAGGGIMEYNLDILKKVRAH